MAEQTQKEQTTEHGYNEPEKYTVGSIEGLLDKMNQEDEK